MQNRAGQQLGNYRLKQRLDGGGYADVYLAEQIYLGMDVAVKVLKSPTLTPVERQKFLDEAKIVAKLDHPHIVKILEFGIETSQQDIHNIPYLVMDYAPQGTLRKLHPRGTRVQPEKIALYVKQIADALEYAHATHNIVHRDVKPENMLIKRTDHILLSDFGIAVAGLTTGNLTKQLALLAANKEVVEIPGTPTYIAPERLGGPIQRSSDQYSLAIVVYEWLTGTPPFTGSETEICNKHLSAAPPSLSKAPHNIAPEIEDVVMKALAKKPDFRYKTVKDFATALEEAVRVARARQVPPAAPYRPPQPNQTPPWVAPQQQQSPPWSAQPPQPPPAQSQQGSAAGLVAANQSPRQAMQVPPHQFSQEQTPASPPHVAQQQQPVPMPQPPNTPPPWTQPTQARGLAMPPHMPGSQPTGVQPALSQQAPPPGPSLQGPPPQVQGSNFPGPQGPPSQAQGSNFPAGAQTPPQGPPGNVGQDHTWALSNAPWHQGGYIPLNASGNTTNSNMTSRGVPQPGQTANAYTTNDIAATAREFGDGFNTFQRWLQSNVELDFEFFRLRRFRLFRWIGFLANILSVTLVGLFILKDWWVWLFGMGFSLFGLFFCIAAVRKPLAITGGFIVAIWWTYVGYGIDLIWPIGWMRPPTVIPQVIFFAVSWIIHIQYALQKNE